VLDKLLEDGRLTIDAMSATSAGAMNAVVTAYGLSIAMVSIIGTAGSWEIPSSFP
jgi:hypothetical protein